MPTTSRGYRYPASSAAPNVPQDLQNLAADLNSDVGTIDTLVDGLAGTTAWTDLTLAAGFENWTGVTGPAPALRVAGNQVYAQGYIQRASSALFTFNTVFTPFSAFPSNARPANRAVLRWGMAQFSSTAAPLVRIEVATTGVMTVNAIGASGTAPSWISFDFVFDKTR